MSQHIADYRDCLELAGKIAGSVECYDSDYLPEVIIPHLKPVIGELQHLEAVNADLLAALKDLMEIQDCADDCWCVEVGNPGTCEACKGRAAIARAEGR